MPSCNVMNNRNESISVINFLDMYDNGYVNIDNHFKISEYIRKHYFDKFPCDNLLILINKDSLKEKKLPKYYKDFIIELVYKYESIYLEYNG